MRSAGWSVAVAVLLTAVVVIGWLATRERRKASAQEDQPGTQQAADQPGPAGGGSPWRTSVVPTTGKPSQVVHLVNTGLASAIDAISVEVYNQEGTPVSWTRVTSLENMGPEDRVYELQALHDGTVLVRFGDGKHGARPPAAPRKGVRVRYPADVGGDGQSTTLETGTSPFGRGGVVDWAQGTLWDESADALREHAAERVFEVITLRPTDEGQTEIKLYEVPGRRLHAFVTEGEDWLAEGETVVSMGVRQ